MDKEEALLIKHESLRLKPYKCSVGKLTIGVGRNLEANGISKGEAMYMLRNDLARSHAELEKFNFGIEPGARKAALVNMLLNLGLPRFKTFKNLIMALELKHYVIAAEEMLDSKWALQVGKRAHELARMVETNKWPDELSEDKGGGYVPD